MTSDDETLNLIIQRPGDEAVRIAEASVGDLRSALKRARGAALTEAGPAGSRPKPITNAKAAWRTSSSKSLAGVSTRPPTESTRIAQTCGFRVL